MVEPSLKEKSWTFPGRQANWASQAKGIVCAKAQRYEVYRIAGS